MAGIVFDLFIFGFYGIGFSGNIRAFTCLEPTYGKTLDFLRSDKEIFRVLPFVLTGENMPWWVKPSSNILVDVDSIASYSPLVQKSYKEALSSLEIVDDSLGLIYPDMKAIGDNYNLLRILNVKYIVANKELNYNFSR
jgi:hypothetical protein